MRLVTGILLSAISLWGQGAGGVQFRDWAAQPVGPKPKIRCEQRRALTSFDLSVISATLIPAVANTPEHCRVAVLVPPEIHIEVNLPAAWNSRLYKRPRVLAAFSVRKWCVGFLETMRPGIEMPKITARHEVYSAG